MQVSQDLNWKKSTYSDGGRQCIEVATNVSDLAPVRDSKDPNGPVLLFSRAALADFAHAAANGEFGDV